MQIKLQCWNVTWRYRICSLPLSVLLIILRIVCILLFLLIYSVYLDQNNVKYFNWRVIDWFECLPQRGNIITKREIEMYLIFLNKFLITSMSFYVVSQSKCWFPTKLSCSIIRSPTLLWIAHFQVSKSFETSENFWNSDTKTLKKNSKWVLNYSANTIFLILNIEKKLKINKICA